MLPPYRELLDNQIEDLCEKMNPEKVVSELLKYRLFDKSDMEKVMAPSTTRDRNVQLVNILEGMEFDTLSEFLRSLSSIDQTHLALAEAIQPVRYRVLWLSMSPVHAAAVVHTLETYANASFTKLQRIGADRSLILRRTRVFKREYSREELAKINIDAQELVKYSHEVEVCLVFPSVGKDPIVCLETFFKQSLISKLDLVVMGGVCEMGGGCGRSFIVSQVTDLKEVCVKPTSYDLTSSDFSKIRDASKEDSLSDHASLQIESCPMQAKSVDDLCLTSSPAADRCSTSDPSMMFDLVTFQFYSLCHLYLPETRSLVCKSNVPFSGCNKPTKEAEVGIVSGCGHESEAVMQSARALMNIITYYYKCNIYSKDF